MPVVMNDTGITFNDGTSTNTNLIPAGTLMLFQQTSAPTGWTKQTTHNDKTLRVVSGAAGSGGSTSFTSVFANQTPSVSTSLSVSNSTLAESQLAAHTHATTITLMDDDNGNNGLYGVVDGDNAYSTLTFGTDSRGSNGAHGHGLSGGVSVGSVTLNVTYVDLIIASKS